MSTPNVGDWVTYILQGGLCAGEARRALVYARWIDDPARAEAFAQKYGTTVEGAIAAHGQRVSLSVELKEGDLPGVAVGMHQVTNVEYAEDGHHGTWGYYDGVGG